MNRKLAQFLAGLVIYFTFGVIMVYVAGQGLPQGWAFVAVWSVTMALAHVFVLEPFRARMAAKNKSKYK